MAILVTGGTGYIGSHTVVELLKIGKEVIIVDNLCNSKISVLDRIEAITGKRPEFIKCDLCDMESLDEVFKNHPEIDSVIHFAALKAVSESISKPIKYYYNNITGTLNLVSCMQKYQVTRLVFSSSATVYGMSEVVPVKEDFPLSTTNPYGETKLMMERIFKDCSIAFPEFSFCVLRYFNPTGAHKSGLLGEDPRGIPNNLMPYIAKVAAGKLECLSIYGNDYNTKDGTGVRDFIHVVDLAQAHLCALEYTEKTKGIEFINVGTGTGYSVLEMVEAFGKAWGAPVKYKFAPRRSGDIAISYADPSKARELLGWEAKRDLAMMCEDMARWQRMNPDGFPD